MKKLVLSLSLVACTIAPMGQVSAMQKPSALEQENNLRDNLKKFLFTAQSHLGLDPQYLAYNDEMKQAARTDERGLIEVSAHILDEDRLKYHISHELGHVKDNSYVKKIVAMSTYYPSCIAATPLLLYGVHHLIPMNRDLITSSYAGLGVFGIFTSLFFHNTVSQIINRHLEKRADLIGAGCLLNTQNYNAISKTLIDLEQSKLLGVKHDGDHPAASDIYNYLTAFLRKNNIDVQSKAQRNADKTLNGEVTLVKDGQTLSYINWRWRPKC